MSVYLAMMYHILPFFASTGLDNVAAEGADAFDIISKSLNEITRQNPDYTEQIQKTIKDLREGKRYLKGEYKANCQNQTSEVADHCRVYALSDPKVKEFQVLQ